MKTYQEVDNYVQDLIQRKAKTIEDILHTWMTVHRSCAMMEPTASGSMGISTTKAAGHLTLVQLYDVILTHRNQYIYSATPKHKSNITQSNSLPLHFSRITLSVNRSDEERNKSLRAREMYDNHIEKVKSDTKQWINNLKLDATEKSLLDDFDNSRIILKNHFKAIFSLYGIDLSDKALRYLFGTLTVDGKVYDNIPLFAKGSSFPFSLRYQFSMTKAGQAHGLFSAFFMRAAGLLKRFSNDPCWIDEAPGDAIFQNAHDPFFSEQKVMRILATVAGCAL